MRILMVHNDYGRYSGEEAMVDLMIADGRAAGYTIEEYRRTSKHARGSLRGNIHGFVSGIYSISGVRLMRQALHRFQPDLVHIHNLYPFISPAALFACRKADVPVVMTVHNYRLICANGLFLRDGHPCEECLTHHNEWNCIRHRCEGTTMRSLGYALRNYIARVSKAYTQCVDYFCCLTQFQRDKLIEAGLDPNKILIFPNYVSQPFGGKTVPTLPSSQRNYIGYVGRLSPEKGYDMLLEVARRHPDIPFRFAGTLRDSATAVSLPNVTYCGLLNHEQLSQFYREARFIVVPSRCYEGFPLVLPEAFSHGRTCIAPNHGPFPDLLRYHDQASGQLFTPGSVADLETTVVLLWHDHQRLSQLETVATDEAAHRFNKQLINRRWHRFLTAVAQRQVVNPYDHME